MSNMEIDHKVQALILTDSFKDYVNPYVGSGMLSNWCDNEAILMQSKKCAIIAVKLVQAARPLPEIKYWKLVESEINNLTIEDLNLPIES